MGFRGSTFGYAAPAVWISGVVVLETEASACASTVSQMSRLVGQSRYESGEDAFGTSRARLPPPGQAPRPSSSCSVLAPSACLSVRYAVGLVPDASADSTRLWRIAAAFRPLQFGALARQHPDQMFELRFLPPRHRRSRSRSCSCSTSDTRSVSQGAQATGDCVRDARGLGAGFLPTTVT